MGLYYSDPFDISDAGASSNVCGVGCKEGLAMQAVSECRMC